jgi:hypothetical protein
MTGEGRLVFDVGVFVALLLLPDLPVLLVFLVFFAPEALALLPLAEVAFVATDMRVVPREGVGGLDILARCSIVVLCISFSLGAPTALLACPGPSCIRSFLRLAPLF